MSAGVVHGLKMAKTYLYANLGFYLRLNLTSYSQTAGDLYCKCTSFSILISSQYLNFNRQISSNSATDMLPASAGGCSTSFGTDFDFDHSTYSFFT